MGRKSKQAKFCEKTAAVLRERYSLRDRFRKVAEVELEEGDNWMAEESSRAAAREECYIQGIEVTLQNAGFYIDRQQDTVKVLPYPHGLR